MPKTSTASTETIYFVAHNGDDIVHYGNVEPGAVVTTGQPNLEEFDTVIEMARCAYDVQPGVFRLWDENDRYEPGEFVRFNSTLYMHTSDEESPWTPVLPADSH